MSNKTLTALEGVQVGHSTHPESLTGCTVVLFETPYMVGYEVGGGAPGTFNTNRLQAGMTDFGTHGLFVAGGSLAGLGSGDAITQAMIDDGISNPAISGAVVFDLGAELGRRYDSAYSREAYQNATRDRVVSGNQGAGTGAAVGKIHYLEDGTKNGGMKAGIGNALIRRGEAVVCALSVVNALGNVMLPDGSFLAGNRDERGGFRTFDMLTDFVTRTVANTTISIVGTNANLGPHENYTRVAQQALNGQVLAIDPIQTGLDGDLAFVFSTETTEALLNPSGKLFEASGWPSFPVDILGHMAKTAVRASIYDACRSAETIQYSRGYEGVIPASPASRG